MRRHTPSEIDTISRLYENNETNIREKRIIIENFKLNTESFNEKNHFPCLCKYVANFA